MSSRTLIYRLAYDFWASSIELLDEVLEFPMRVKVFKVIICRSISEWNHCLTGRNNSAEFNHSEHTQELAH
jgi:hypothetical protein